MSWINLLQQATNETESPRSFILWSGLCSISAVVAHNVYLKKKGYHLHPNLYCLLVARSGFGKNLPISMARNLVTRVDNTRVITGRYTIEKLLKDLSTSKSNEQTGELKFKDARGMIASAEFATSFQHNDELFTILTDLYDTHNYETLPWINGTKSGGIETLTRPCITIFSGSSPEHFEDFVPKVNIHGGFIGRTLLVYEEEKHGLFSGIEYDGESEINYDFLSAHLKLLKDLKGPFEFRQDAKRHYQEWYEEFYTKDHDDKTGTVERFKDHILKVAMCYALTRMVAEPQLVITKEDIELALRVTAKLKFSVKALTAGSGKSGSAAQSKTILALILKSPDFTIDRDALLQRGFGEFNHVELDTVAETLIQTGFIKQTGLVGKISYSVTEKGKELWGQIKDKRK